MMQQYSPQASQSARGDTLQTLFRQMSETVNALLNDALWSAKGMTERAKATQTAAAECRLDAFEREITAESRRMVKDAGLTADQIRRTTNLRMSTAELRCIGACALEILQSPASDLDANLLIVQDYLALGTGVCCLLDKAVSAVTRQDSALALEVRVERCRIICANETFHSAWARCVDEGVPLHDAVGLLVDVSHLIRIADHAANMARRALRGRRSEESGALVYVSRFNEN